MQWRERRDRERTSEIKEKMVKKEEERASLLLFAPHPDDVKLSGFIREIERLSDSPGGGNFAACWGILDNSNVDARLQPSPWTFPSNGNLIVEPRLSREMSDLIFQAGMGFVRAQGRLKKTRRHRS